MNFFEAIKSVFSKSFQFSGRAVRSEFWYFMLFQLIIIFVVFPILVMSPILLFVHFLVATPASSQPWILAVPVGIFSLAIFIPNITVGVRRFHDMDQSGWWMAWWMPASYMILGLTLSILEVIPTILFFYWMCRKGTKGENRFGPDPFMSHRHFKK